MVYEIISRATQRYILCKSCFRPGPTSQRSNGNDPTMIIRGSFAEWYREAEQLQFESLRAGWDRFWRDLWSVFHSSNSWLRRTQSRTLEIRRRDHKTWTKQALSRILAHILPAAIFSVPPPVGPRVHRAGIPHKRQMCSFTINRNFGPAKTSKSPSVIKRFFLSPLYLVQLAVLSGNRQFSF